MARVAAAGGDMLSYHFTRYQDIYIQTLVLQSQTERYGDTMDITSVMTKQQIIIEYGLWNTQKIFHKYM